MSDEAVRRRVMAGGGRPEPRDRQLVEVDRAEAMRLLAGVAYGRLVFTLHALPAIRPVNHVIDAGEIIVRTRLAAKVATAISPPRDTVVAYQADLIDPQTRLGWSIVVTGYASPVTDPAEVERLEEMLVPWIDMPMDTVLRIRPEIINGFRLVEAGE